MAYNVFRRGFSLMELLLVVTIISILAAILISNLLQAKEAVYFTRATAEMRSFGTALTEYNNANNGAYPPDANRDIPPGLETYLAGSGNWPKAPWPGSVYDWDNWTDPVTNEQIYQLSIRFCPTGGLLSACRFPQTDWAKNFDINSSVYRCFEGPCRPHINEACSYPGYCVHCPNHGPMC